MISTTSYVGRTLKSSVLVLPFLLSSGSSVLTVCLTFLPLWLLCWSKMKEILFSSPGMTISVKDLHIFPGNPSRNLCHQRLSFSLAQHIQLVIRSWELYLLISVPLCPFLRLVPSPLLSWSSTWSISLHCPWFHITWKIVGAPKPGIQDSLLDLN